MIQHVLFYIIALLITICSIAVITARNPVTSAMFLVGDLFLLAANYAMMDAHFVAAIQVLVYAGAIVVLFVFVIMLLNLNPNERERYMPAAPEVAIGGITVLGFIIIAGLLAFGHPTGADGGLTVQKIDQLGGNTFAVGIDLFTRYLWPFELASILILLAVVAAVVIAKKDKPERSEAAGGKRRVGLGAR